MEGSRNVFISVSLGIVSLLLLSCGGGGDGGGGGGSPPAAQTTTVSGSVQAPGGQVTFNQPQGILQQFAQFIAPSAYASVSGLSPVPDGTSVQLIRLNATGISFTVLASTTTTGGRYSFNLTNLGLQPSSDLAIRVANGATQMRAFLTGQSVDIDPASETAVQLVLEQVLATPGVTIDRYTVRELADLTGSINTLSAVKQLTAGLNIANTIISIRNAVTAEPGLMAFITAAAGDGQTTEGPGDIGNYFPFEQGNIWRYQGIVSLTGMPTVNFSDSVSVTGTKVIGGVTTIVFLEENHNNEGKAEEDYEVKDTRAITLYGNNDLSDLVTPQLVPIKSVRFPLATGDAVELVDRKGLNSGLDLDGDGKPERVDVKVEYTVLAFETVTVPAGTFSSSAKVEIRQTDTFFSSAFGISATIKTTQTEWLAPGFGFIKKMEVTQSEGFSDDFNQTVTEELVGAVANGQGTGLRIEVTPSSSSVAIGGTKQLTALLFDQKNAPIPGFSFIWSSSNPVVASIDPNGFVTGLVPGTVTVTASVAGITSNGATVNVSDVRILNLSTNDIIYDPNTKKIYASIPGSPGSIRSIDPMTGNIGPPIPVGNEPLKLALSDNGQYLYVGLDGEGAVQRVDLTTQTTGPKFSLGSDPFFGSYFVEDMQVLPGNPQSVAISRQYKGVSPRHAGVAIFDNGAQRSNVTPGHTGSNVIEFSQSASTLYGYNNETTEFGFRRMAVDSSGVTVLDVFDSFMGSLISGFGVDITFDGGRIYSTSGKAIDPVTRTVAGTFQHQELTFDSPVRPDSSLRRVFFLSGAGISQATLFVFDLDTFQFLKLLRLDGVVNGVGSSFSPHTSLIRWGGDGLAFRTTGSQVFLIRTSSIP